jgi:hypothetical protein
LRVEGLGCRVEEGSRVEGLAHLSTPLGLYGGSDTFFVTAICRIHLPAVQG